MQLSVDGKTAFAYTGSRPLEPNEPSVVFIHGAGMDHSIWTLQSRYFAHHGYNVVALDLPGHGRSAGPALAAIETMADWIAHLLDAAGLAQAAVVGHSMGSLVALETAARHPARVRALALLGIAAPMPVGQPLLDAARADNHAALDMITLWSQSNASQIGGNRAPGMWLTGGALRLLERAAPGVLYTDLNACNEFHNGLESAARIDCPTLLILGDRDLMTPPRNAQALQEAITGARSVVLKNCGHLMFAERPDEVLDALIGVL